MKKQRKKLLAAFLGFQLLFIAPIIAESIASQTGDFIPISQSELVIDSLHTQEPPGAPPGETMVATYYSKCFQGRKTASGERYDNTALTCAHRNIPFQTLLKVTNPKTSQSVTVRVNDRGPFTRGRDLDLSYAAAKQLGLLAVGVAPVEVEIISEENPEPKFAKQ